MCFSWAMNKPKTGKIYMYYSKVQFRIYKTNTSQKTNEFNRARNKFNSSFEWSQIIKTSSKDRHHTMV